MSVDDNIAASVNNLSLSVYDESICANCGKVVSNPNVCNKCKSAKYCNAACKKKHRSKHKQDCERRVAKLQEEQLERERRAAELHDEKLFKKPPPKGDCDICMLPLPSIHTGSKWKSCCGKEICNGCIHAVRIRDGSVVCPFCRTPTQTTDEEQMERLQKRMKVDDAKAMYILGCFYDDGKFGLPQDHTKALELWHQSANLGHATSYYNIGNSYYKGEGEARDEMKAIHYYEVAAIGGITQARHNLGMLEGSVGNYDRSLKHFMIAAGGGMKISLSEIQEMFKAGHATKDDYTQALRAYQVYLGEVKSAQRDEAAAAVERYKLLIVVKKCSWGYVANYDDTKVFRIYQS